MKALKLLKTLEIFIMLNKLEGQSSYYKEELSKDKISAAIDELEKARYKEIELEKSATFPYGPHYYQKVNFDFPAILASEIGKTIFPTPEIGKTIVAATKGVTYSIKDWANRIESLNSRYHREAAIVSCARTQGKTKFFSVDPLILTEDSSTPPNGRSQKTHNFIVGLNKNKRGY